MDKKKKTFMLVIVVMMLMTFMLQANATQKTFTVDFEDGTFGDLSAVGEISIESDGDNKVAKTVDSLMGIARLIMDTNISDFDVVFDVKISTINKNSANIGISASRNNGGNDQYDINYDSTFDFFVVNKYVAGTKTELGKYQEDTKLEKDEWYTLGVRVKNNEISWYKDGQLVLSATDDSGVLAGGEVQLVAYANGVSFDNVKYGEADSINMATGKFYANEPTTPETENPPTFDAGSGLILSMFVLVLLAVSFKRLRVSFF